MTRSPLFLRVSALALAVTALFCGCRKQSARASVPFAPRLAADSNGAVVIAGNYANFEALEAEFDRFNAYYPNITLSYESLDNYNDSILPALKGAAAPDIYFTFTWMLDKPQYDPLYAAAENLADPSLEIDLGAIRQELLTRQRGGQVLMAPVLVSTYGMLVNRDLFRSLGIAVPTTYSAFKAVCAALLDAGYETPVLGYNRADRLLCSYAVPYFCDTISRIPGSVPQLNALERDAGTYLAPVLSLTEDIMQTGAINLAACSSLENDYNAVIMRFFEGDVPIVFANGDLVSGTKKRERQSESFMKQPFAYTFHPVPVSEDDS